MRLFLFFMIIIALTGCEDGFENDLTGEKVQLLAPANNVISEDSLQTFYWEPLDGATAYQVQIVSPRFDSIIRLETDTLTSRNQIKFQLRIGQYSWRVKAINNSSNSQISDNFFLSIQ